MKRIMINPNNCKGCKNCSIACMQAHSEGAAGSFHSLDLADPANEARNAILLNSKNEFKPLFCRHCDQPECVSSCMSGALTKDNDTGFVRYDKSKCGSCFMCVMNCPYGVLKPDKATKTSVIKCDFCEQNGDNPSCVKACRSGAIYVEDTPAKEPDDGNALLEARGDKNTAVKHVIIGAGAAGISAAKTIRKLKPGDEIAIVSTDDSVYSRCMLHNYISGERDENGLSFITDNFFAENNIRWISGKTVAGVDTDNKLINFAGGTEPYDKLLIATGSDSTDLPIVQSQNPKNVLGLRHLSDAKAIKERARDAENILIIGAGLVGLDAAYALADMGKKPTIVDMEDSILALNLDRYAADVYKQKFEEAGCTFRLGEKVSQADSDSAGNIVSLTLSSGEKLLCDLVIVAIGSQPAVDFLADSKVNCAGGAVVDKYLHTNIEDIYAAGDAAGLSGIWPNAIKQGAVAAKNMCGIPVVYDDVFALKNTINYFGIPSLSLGEVEPAGGDMSKIRKDRNNYKKIILRDGIVAGVILQGCIAHSGFWQFLIKNNIDVAWAKDSVFDLSFADFYGIRENGEFQWDV